MSEELTIEVPNELWLSANDDMHWAKKMKRVAGLRASGKILALNAKLPHYRVAHVMVFVGYPTAGRADPANASPTTKALIDGIIDAGILPDDDDAHLIGPDYRREATKSRKGTHTIRFVFTNQIVAFTSDGAA